MSLFNAITSKLKPTLRFNQGFERMGAYTKPADTRTTEQLLENIEFPTFFSFDIPPS